MAICYPPNIFEYTKSSAEKKIFKILEKNPLTKNWIILHSLGLPPGTSRDKYRFGEIDFVLLIPEFGIICIEAKSSNVKCENGIWTIFNRYNGNFEKLKKSPFQQAKDGMFKLNELLTERLRDSTKEIWKKISSKSLGMHVMFIECSNPTLPSDINRDDLTCEDDFTSNEELVHRLIKSVNLQLNASNSFEFKNRHFDSKLVKSIKECLRPNFEFLVKLSYLNNLVDEAICSFSEEQQEHIDEIEENIDSNPKFLFQGPPGTGKSFLAIELYKRLSRDNKVCFLYFNKLIKSAVKSKLNKEDMKSENCFIIHDLMMKIVGKSQIKEEYEKECFNKKDKEIFDSILPKYALAAIDKTDQFDVVIVDEAQDIISDINLEFIDNLLKNKFNESSLFFFGDFENQNLYQKKSITDYNNYFDQRFWKRSLKKNYRNGINIGKHASAFGGYDKLPYILITEDYKLPKLNFYKNQADFIDQVITLIKSFDYDLIKQGIVFLSQFKFNKSILNNVNFSEFNFDLTILNEKNINSFLYKKDQVYFSTVHSFKGLEASNIIYIDLNFDENASLIDFIALTRAKSNLTIFIEDKYKKNTQQIHDRLLKYEINER